MSDNGESAYVREIDAATREEHDRASRRVFAWLQRQKRTTTQAELHAWEWRAVEAGRMAPPIAWAGPAATEAQRCAYWGYDAPEEALT